MGETSIELKCHALRKEKRTSHPIPWARTVILPPEKGIG
jgi:hypothetical protein